MLLLITGKKSAGKDTAANYIASKVGNAKILAMATPIKLFLSKLLNLSLDEIENHKRYEDVKLTFLLSSVATAMMKVTNELSIRELLILCGEGMKEFTGNKTVWCSGVMNELSQNSINIISDIRFMEEYNYFTTNYHNGNIFVLKIVDEQDFIETTNRGENQSVEFDVDKIPFNHLIINRKNDLFFRDIDNFIRMYL